MSEAALHPSDEPHYTVYDLADLWKVSHMTIRRWCEGEPGVLVFGSDETRYGRKRKTLRIPESAKRRIYEKHMAQ